MMTHPEYAFYLIGLSPAPRPVFSGVLVEEMLEELVSPMVDGRTTGAKTRIDTGSEDAAMSHVSFNPSPPPFDFGYCLYWRCRCVLPTEPIDCVPVFSAYVTF